MRKLLFLFVAVMLFCSAAEAATFGNYVGGIYKQFEISNATNGNPIAGVTGVAFDPTDTNKLYVGSSDATEGTRGVYYVDVANESLAVKIGSLVDDNKCYDVTVDNSGNVYYSTDASPQIIKLEDPLDMPASTQMMGNIGNPAYDDDPFCISMLPTNFGGSFNTGQDILVMDLGLDENAENPGYFDAVYVVDKDSVVGAESTTLIWQSSTNMNFKYAESSNYDGYLYMTPDNMLTDTVGGDSRFYISRMNADGVLQRMFLDIDIAAFVSSTGEMDEAITVNDADGSIWIISEAGDRVVYRIDAANATDMGGGDFLASITAEISDLTLNASHNGMDIVGDKLVIADVAGYEHVTIFTLVPEPATMLLLTTGLMFIRRRRK